MGRFVGRDPLALNTVYPSAGNGYQDGLSLYAYVNNGTTWATDPKGQYVKVEIPDEYGSTIPMNVGTTLTADGKSDKWCIYVRITTDNEWVQTFLGTKKNGAGSLRKQPKVDWELVEDDDFSDDDVFCSGTDDNPSVDPSSGPTVKNLADGVSKSYEYLFCVKCDLSSDECMEADDGDEVDIQLKMTWNIPELDTPDPKKGKRGKMRLGKVTKVDWEDYDVDSDVRDNHER